MEKDRTGYRGIGAYPAIGLMRCRWQPKEDKLTIVALDKACMHYLRGCGEYAPGEEFGAIPGTDGECLQSLGRLAMRTGRPGETTISLAGRPVRITVCPVSGDELLIILAAGKDTEIRESLENEFRDWENTFDAIGDLVTIQDSEMRIIRANRAAHEMFGFEEGSLTGKICFRAFQDSDSPCRFCPVVEAASSGDSCSGVVYNEKLGKTFDVRSSPIISEKGELKWIVHIARDVTRESALEKQLQQAMKMEAIGTLAGGIAHDFNNILSAIIGYGHIARERLEHDHPAQADLDQVLQGAERAVDLVKQILTFARQETSEQLSPLKLQYIVKEVLKLMRSSMPSTIELRQYVENGCPPILADPGQIHQLLMNLLANGKQAIGGGHGTLGIELREAGGEELLGMSGFESIGEGQYAYLSVGDNGCGMDQQMLERIFDPFFTTQAKEHGTGLGLAVVHGIVKKHGGLIGVESEPGSGTTFHIAFPVTDQPIVPEHQDVPLAAPDHKRIMVVDDEVEVGSVMAKTLKSLGYSVHVFSDSLEALRAYRKEPMACDLVLTDMTMPNMTGSELAREVLSLRPEIPVIMLTGYSEIMDRDKALQQGIREFLLKPVRREVIAKVLREVLAGGEYSDR